MAIATSALEMRSPAVSSMSISRGGGAGHTCLARSSKSSVVSPIAETTTTTSWPAFLVSTMRSATRRIRSASATDDPPYFCTTSATLRTSQPRECPPKDKGSRNRSLPLHLPVAWLTMSDRLARTSVPIHPPIAARWSPRAFDANAVLNHDDLTALLEAARWAATWGHREPVRYVVGCRGREEQDGFRGDETFATIAGLL